MRLTDIGLSLPTILIAVVMVAVSEPSFRNVILVIALLLWPRFARQIRGETLAHQGAGLRGAGGGGRALERLDHLRATSSPTWCRRCW